MTTKDEIYKHLIKVAAEVFSVSPSEISINTKAGALEQWDSFGHLMLFMALEEKLGVKFKTEEIVRLSSIGEIAESVLEKQKVSM